MANARKLIVASAVLSSLALVACGGGSGASASSPSAPPASTSSSGGGMSADEYVGKLCTNFKQVTDRIQERTSSLQDFTPATLEEGKQVFVDYLSFVVDQFTVMSDDLDALGTPDVPGAAES